MSEIGAIDPWVNLSMLGGQPPPDWLVRVKEDYFKGGEDFMRELSPEELIAQMDAAGVEKAILSIQVEAPQSAVLDCVKLYPDRLFLAAGCDPTRHMKSCWALEDLAAEYPVVMARVVPFIYDIPPDHRDYYPLYAKCCDLDLPISINTGIPGPPKPGECQHPMHLDRVCYDFPRLRVSMAHGADPWWDVAIRLMLKYKGLHLMTSAYLPRYFPEELIHFMNTRGQDKIIYASDHPVLSMERCLSSARELDCARACWINSFAIMPRSSSFQSVCLAGAEARRRKRVDPFVLAHCGGFAYAESSANSKKGLPPMSLSLQEISDRIEIDDLLKRYTSAIDGKDYALLDTCFLPDAHVDYVSSGGIAGAYPEVRAWLEKALAIFSASVHSITNSEVELDGDRAKSRTVVHNPMVFPGEKASQIFTVFAYYHDELVRTEEGWRIARRIEEQILLDGNLPGGVPAGD